MECAGGCIADLRRMGISGWMEKARNRNQWRRITEEAKAHPGLWRREEEVVSCT